MSSVLLNEDNSNSNDNNDKLIHESEAEIDELDESEDLNNQQQPLPVFNNDDNDDLVDSTPVDNISIDHTPIDNNIEDSNNNNDNDDNIEGNSIVTTNNGNGNNNDNNNKPLNKKSRTKNSSLIPDNQYVNLENMPKKRKRAPPQPFNPTLNNASLSSSSNVKSRYQKADPYHPQIPPPDFAKPSYTEVEQYFHPMIEHQRNCESSNEKIEPVRFPVVSKPNYVVTGTTKIPQNYIVPVPLDTYTKSDYKVRRWMKEPKTFTSISGSTLRFKSWYGSQYSQYAERPPPPPPSNSQSVNDNEADSKVDKRTREYKMKVAAQKAQIEKVRVEEERARLEAKAAYDNYIDEIDDDNKSDNPSIMSINNMAS